MRRRLTILAALTTVLATAFAPAAAATPDDARRQATYEITITNLTRGQWLTPPATATHARTFDPFDVGKRASEGIQQIAENGNLGPFTDVLDSSMSVFDWKVALATPELLPLGPGQAVTFRLDGDHRARWLSFVSMLICTNDGFTGVDSVRLPRHVGQPKTFTTRAFDAGTEINTEAWADLVPPCAMLTGFGDQGGTGVSNPDLAEHGRIHPHRGILGGADLVPAIHGFSGAISKVEVTRID